MTVPSDLIADCIPAATLVVMRENGSLSRPPELLMVTRTGKMAFAAGAVVFPGGRVDPMDREIALRDGRSDDGGKVTAIRETLEESGVAVALGVEEPERGLHYQQALLSGTSFEQLVKAEKLVIDYDALKPFTRWIPGIPQPRRFDTIFYVAKAPPRTGEPCAQPGECMAAEWVGAAEQLGRIDAGQAHAIFPTKRNLERLAGFHSYAEALEDISAHGAALIMPEVREMNGQKFVTIPEGRGYPVTAEPIETAFRS